MGKGSSSSIRIGLIGFGNIGTGVVRWLRRNQDRINSRLPCPLELARIADIDIDSDRGIPIGRELLTTDYREILGDPSIQIVIELIGGVGIAQEVVRSALEAGKHVVTANKALLATHGAELMAMARERGLQSGLRPAWEPGFP